MPEATLYLELSLPSAWPPAERVFFGRFDTPAGLLEISAVTDGRLSFQVEDAAGVVQHSLVSRPISRGNSTWCKIAIAVDDGGIRAFADAQPLRADTEAGDAPLVLAERASADGPNQDMLDQARIQRQTLIRTSPRNGRRPLTQDELRTALREELDQVADLIDLMLAGKRHHARGLAARLRLLVASPTRTSTPLLQLVAAHADRPLVVRADRLEGDALSGAQIVLPAQVFAAAMNEAGATDLDVWLQDASARLGGSEYTNNSILRAVADTIGAHHDPDIEPLVEELRKHISGGPAGAFTTLDLWLVSFANVVLQLGRAVLK